jgi:putative peptidoglycan lipid II flippase
MNLLKTLAAVSSMTLISRLLGFVRDTIIARVFGAGFATDAFFVAFKLPNMLRRIFAEGAFSQAFVPVLAEYKEKCSEEETKHFLANVSGMLTLVLSAVTALGILAAPVVIWVSAPGFAKEPSKFALTASLLRITFPYILLISLSSLAGSVLNTWRQFQIPAFTPTLLNITTIIGAVLFAPYFHPPVLVLAWATFVGGIAQLAFQLPYLRKIDMMPLPRIAWRDSAVWRVIRQMGPAILGVSVAQISLLINTTFASFLPSGSVSWMYYADRMMEFPSGVLGVALGTILLPSLSRHAAKDSKEEYSRLLDWGIRLSLLLALPASVGLALTAKPLIATLFMYGKFKAFDAQMTERALIAYSIGLVGLIVVKILAPGFYAKQNIKTPVRVAIFTLISTQLMNLIFVWNLKHAGLALSISLASCLNAGILLKLLLKHGIYQPQPGWRTFGTKLAIALVAMAAVLIALQWMPIDWQGRAWHRALALAGIIGAGAATYFVTLFALGFRPRDFMHREA